MSTKEGSPVPVYALDDEARQVPIPNQGSEYICPSCEQPIPTKKQIRLAKPAKYEGQLNDIFKCPNPHCRFIFSPKNVAIVLRR